MKFWITTPSYNMGEWLPMAIASVVHQAGSDVEVHHHVQDGESKDGTVPLLEEHLAKITSNPVPGYSFSYESASDDGMYDAINMGWKHMPEGYDVVSYLNCDEQYLLGTLEKVGKSFRKHLSMEVLMADFIILSQDLQYICHKRSVKPVGWMSRFCSIGSPCATFMRASAFYSKQLTFDTCWKIVGDVVWFKEMEDKKVNFRVMHEFVTAFVDVEGNLSESPQALEERKKFRENFQGKWAFLAQCVYKMHALRRWLTNATLPAPKSVDVLNSERLRTEVQIEEPTCRWRRNQSTC